MNRVEAKAAALESVNRPVAYAPYIALHTTALPEEFTLKTKLWMKYAKVKWGTKEWFMGYYRRYAYRHVSRLLHKFNLHYMTVMPHIPGDNPREVNHWCQWCGLRGKTYTYDMTISPQRQNFDPL